jgi:hypothetical protein
MRMGAPDFKAKDVITSPVAGVAQGLTLSEPFRRPAMPAVRLQLPRQQGSR